jgi:nucleoside-diphosphate-sugar epimerase
MLHAFITGGAGLIGSHTTRHLIDEGVDVTVYDSFQQYAVPPSSTFFENLQYRSTRLLQDAEVVRGSTVDKDHLRRELLRARPEYVIHLAALPLARLAFYQPEEAFSSILTGTANLLDAARSLPGLRKLVYVSSSMAYGNFGADPMAEDAAKDPVDIYGAMKLSGEVLLRAYGRQYGIPYVIVRPSAVYGPADNNLRVVQQFAEQAARGELIVAEDPRRTMLDFTYVTDVARGLALAALTPDLTADDFNITFGRARSLQEMLDVLRQHFPDLRARARARTETYRPVRGTLDTSRARTLLGFAPEFDLEQGVAEYVEYMRSINVSLFKKL